MISICKSTLTLNTEAKCDSLLSSVLIGKWKQLCICSVIIRNPQIQRIEKTQDRSNLMYEDGDESLCL